MGKCLGNSYCDCGRCKKRRQHESNESWADDHGGRRSHPEMYRGRPRVPKELGIAGDVAVAAISVGGLASNPAPLPDTDQLEDSRQTKIQRDRDSIEEASNQRQVPGTSQRK